MENPHLYVQYQRKQAQVRSTCNQHDVAISKKMEFNKNNLRKTIIGGENRLTCRRNDWGWTSSVSRLALPINCSMVMVRQRKIEKTCSTITKSIESWETVPSRAALAVTPVRANDGTELMERRFGCTENRNLLARRNDKQIRLILTIIKSVSSSCGRDWEGREQP